MQFVNEKDITVEKFKEAPEVLQTKENEETKKKIEILESYLPKQLSAEEIKAEIDKLEDKSIPSVMKHFKMNFAGKVDMGLVNKIAKSL